jgi:Tol biopolymer transport system component
MTRFDDLDRAMDAYMAAESGATAVPQDLLEQTLAITGARRPRPGWLARVTGLDVHGWSGGRPVSRAVTLGLALVALLVAALAVGVAGGAFRDARPLVLVEATPSAAAPSPVPSVTPAPTAYPVLAGEPWIVHMSNTAGGGTDRIFLMRPDGSDRQQLVTGLDGEQEHPDWSPDGSLIAFDRHYRDPARPGMDLVDVWVMNADGSDPRRVAWCEAPCYQLAYPAWSPDGRSLAVSRFDELSDGAWGPSAVEVIDVATGTRRVAYETPDGSTTMHVPRWSPDGTTILFALETYTDVAETTLESSVVATVAADGSSESPTTLTPEGVAVDAADWHPDGDRILFGTAFDPTGRSTRSEPTDLWSMRVDGTDLRNLTNFGSGVRRAIQGTWTPDGTAIVFTLVEGIGNEQMARIATMNADGTGVVVLESDLGPGVVPRLGFGDGTGGRLRPVPDGAASSP